MDKPTLEWQDRNRVGQLKLVCLDQATGSACDSTTFFIRKVSPGKIYLVCAECTESYPLTDLNEVGP